MDELVARFIKNGRLVIMPSKRSKLRPVLLRYNDDYASLRRYLVDEGFMTRESGLYWRSGGTAGTVQV